MESSDVAEKIVVAPNGSGFNILESGSSVVATATETRYSSASQLRKFAVAARENDNARERKQ